MVGSSSSPEPKAHKAVALVMFIHAEIVYITLVLSSFLSNVHAEDINDKFQCFLTDQEAIDLQYDGTEEYKVIDQTTDVRTTITRFTICRPLSPDMTASAPSDYIIYTVECFQLGNQLLSSVTSADIVDTYNAQALQCRTSLRSVVSNSGTTMADPFISTIVTDTTASTPYITTPEGRFNMSSVVSMQVVDMEGFVVEKVTTVQTIRLRLQAFSTAVYQLPYVNRCWYDLSYASEEKDRKERETTRNRNVREKRDNKNDTADNPDKGEKCHCGKIESEENREKREIREKRANMNDTTDDSVKGEKCCKRKSEENREKRETREKRAKRRKDKNQQQGEPEEVVEEEERGNWKTKGQREVQEEEVWKVNEDTVFLEYGCALLEPVLIDAGERKGNAFVSNGPLEKLTLPFNLQSLYDLDFDTLTFKCEVDLCTPDQYCRVRCPAEEETYRLPPNKTIYGVVSTTVSVKKQQTTTTTQATKKTTKNNLIIRHTEHPPPPRAAPKTGMDKAQPYLVIGCIIVGCIIMFLLCYLSFRIISSKDQEPGTGNTQDYGKSGNPQDYGKYGQPGSLPGHVGPGHGGGRTGFSPPPGYSNGGQHRGRGTASTPSQGGQYSHSMSQPLLAPSPTRGRLPQQSELIMSPGRLSDAYYRNSSGLPSRYQDSQCGGTVVGGEYYPMRERPAGQLIGRELYYLPEEFGHGQGSSLSKGRDPGSADKRMLSGLLAREAALRQGSATRRDLFGGDRDAQVHKSDVGNLISKSISEYIDRHGVAALADKGEQL